MSQNKVHILKNKNLNRILYFISLFVMLPLAIGAIFMGWTENINILLYHVIPISEPLSGILLLLGGIIIIVGWPLYVLDIEVLKVIIDQNGIDLTTANTILRNKNGKIAWTNVKKIVPYKKRGKITKLKIVKSSGGFLTINVSNFSNQDKSNIVSTIKSHYS